jgi:hypothetical protein
MLDGVCIAGHVGKISADQAFERLWQEGTGRVLMAQRKTWPATQSVHPTPCKPLLLLLLDLVY